ncbi:transporter substrate-binding domain-containing protein [Pseudodesulfovibrio sp. JC047]|uniref:substrate-binding periplasmic protein n=1 Tax=Pseudodesulfovibrio sp. JC047 TaxID=2683199 RepID=UPI0013D607B7|nr:transporter substrate-binding domain-containing protein [Pseudodesulfovibrio sp. JC047]NDV18809.1 transporter substrate-binding domain-containing protein [Pseudodesulfovibrio sp. JC047]
MILRCCLFVVVLVLFQPVSALSERLHVVTEEWPPYTQSCDGKTSGVVTEIVRATLDRAGLAYSLDVYPWARAYDMARTQKNVLIYPIFKMPKRAEHFKWIKIQGLSVEMYLFSPKYRTDITLTSLDEARKYRIGVTRETSTHHFLLSRGFREGVNLFPVNCEQQNELKSSPDVARIDLTTGDALSLAYWLKHSGRPVDYWVPRVPLFQEDFYMAFGQQTSDAVVEIVERAFTDIYDEGRLDTIVEAYWRLFE